MGKKKKEKVIYIDDGSTIADMSGVSGPRLGKRNPSNPRPDPKDVWHTYWSAVRSMIGPLLVVLCIIAIVYMILYAVFWFM